MYRCQICGEQVPAGYKRQLIVIKEPYVHPYRAISHQKWLNVGYVRPKWKWDWVDDRGGTGTRIVKEIPVCVPCKAREQA